MAPRNRDDNFMDVDSDSDISLLGDVEHRGKGKGKGKATDKRKKDKGKAKAKEVSFCCAVQSTTLNIHFLFIYSKLTLGRHPTLVLGTLCRKMRLEACRVQWKILWRGAGAEGPSMLPISCVFANSVSQVARTR